MNTVLLFHFLATNCFLAIFFPGTDKPTVCKIKNETRKKQRRMSRRASFEAGIHAWLEQ